MAEQSNRRVKRKNKVFTIPLFQLENFPYSIIAVKEERIISLKTSAYSIIPHHKMALFHSYNNKNSVILTPLFLFTPKSRTSHVKSFIIKINSSFMFPFFILFFRLVIQTKTVLVNPHYQDLIMS